MMVFGSKVILLRSLPITKINFLFCSIGTNGLLLNYSKHLFSGHVLGAAMFMIEIAGVRVLYTGDYSREEDRHLMAAEIPAVRPDVLITVSLID